MRSMSALAILVFFAGRTLSAGDEAALKKELQALERFWKFDAANWRAEGRAEAERDLAAGKLRLGTLGQPASWSRTYEAIAKDKLGLEIQHVAGCIVPEEFRERTEGYNEPMRREVERRFGAAVLDDLAKLAMAQRHGDKEKVKAGQVTPPERLPPFFGFTGKTDPGAVPVIMWVGDVYHKVPRNKDVDEYPYPVLFADVLREQDQVKTIDGMNVSTEEFLKRASKGSVPILVAAQGALDFASAWTKAFRPETMVVILKRQKQPIPSREELKVGLPPNLGISTDDNSDSYLIRKRLIVSDQVVRLYHSYYRYTEKDIEVETVAGKRVPFKDFQKQAKKGSFFVLPPYAQEIDAKWLGLFKAEALVVSNFDGRGELEKKR